MRIAVNARCLKNVQMGAGYWTFNLFKVIVQQHPEHQFIFYTDEPIHLELEDNSKFQLIGKPIRSTWQLNTWLNSKLRKAVQQQADILISLDGSGCIKAGFPQIIGLKDTKLLSGNSWVESWYRRQHFQKLVIKAKQLVAVSSQVRQQLASSFKVSENRIEVIAQAPTNIYKPLEWEQKQHVKDQYTDGKEFFLFTGGFDPPRNLLTTLKAFSWFKKWQQSNMKLVIVGDIQNDTSNLKEKIDTFKFRDDVVVLGKLSPDQMHEVMASAYAMLYPSKLATFGMPVLEAMRCGTPVISSAAIAPEVGGEAVMYVEADDEKDISNAMIKLYQDEDFRSRLVEKGLEHSNEFSWVKAAEKLWRLIEETVQQRDEGTSE
jgi:glycosyltransferase involved in cell wall biosynthesis